MSHYAEYTELQYHDDGANSHKYYRAYIISAQDNHNDVRVLFNWGRVGTIGGFKVTTATSHSDAARQVSMQLATKERKGYEIVTKGQLPTVPADLASRAGITASTKPVTLSPLEQITMDTERAVRLLTGPSELSGEAVTLCKGIHATLNTLRQQVNDAEGRVEVVDTLLRVKVG